MKKRAWTPSGLVFSFFFCFSLTGLAWFWLAAAGLAPGPAKLFAENPQAGTLKHMQQISRAQQIYFEKSGRILDQNQFAQFLAHLWITPDHQGKGINLDLIPKRMALAMGRKQTLNGYFFVDVHHRFSGNRKHAIDYQSQWAVAAIPADMPKSGFLVFLADESGKVYAKSFTARPTKFPVLPLEAGWRAVASETDLGGEF